MRTSLRSPERGPAGATELDVLALTNATYSFLPNGTLQRTGGLIDLVAGDFANSAHLRRVFVPVGATLSAASAFDYAPLVRPGIASVPLPGAVHLLGSAVRVLATAGRRRKARVSGS